jgi:trimethylamine--corrinoid protein Co-methyltransferase
METAMIGSTSKRRGREGRLAQRSAASGRHLPTLVRHLEPFSAVDEEAIERIHNASMRILEEIGVSFRDDTALDDWRRIGATVKDDRVFIDRHMVMELIGRAPSEFEMVARNPNRRIRIGGRNTVFGPMQGAPHVRDLDGTRRLSTVQDVENFCKLTNAAPCLHIAGGFTCEPNDIPVPWRHLDWVSANLIHTDMPFFGAGTSKERAEDSVEMARIVHGGDFVREQAPLMVHISGNSPLLWDETMLQAARVYAYANQTVLLSPFVLAAANTPANIPGTVAQLNAEALAGIAYVQGIAPGTRTIYGQYMASVSMQNGAPMASTPELWLMVFVVGQLARKYGLPWRTTGAQASSKTFDAQSGYETAPGMMGGILAGANLMLHCGGWDEAGLAICYGKFVVDCEQNELYHRFGQGIDFEYFDEAFDAIRGVTPGGHYLGADFTIKHFRDAFVRPQLFDYTHNQLWTAEGSKDLWQRARERAKRCIAEAERPAMDSSRYEELLAFVARRKTEISPSIV